MAKSILSVAITLSIILIAVAFLVNLQIVGYAILQSADKLYTGLPTPIDFNESVYRIYITPLRSYDNYTIYFQEINFSVPFDTYKTFNFSSDFSFYKGYAYFKVENSWIGKSKIFLAQERYEKWVLNEAKIIKSDKSYTYFISPFDKGIFAIVKTSSKDFISYAETCGNGLCSEKENCSSCNFDCGSCYEQKINSENLNKTSEFKWGDFFKWSLVVFGVSITLGVIWIVYKYLSTHHKSKVPEALKQYILKVKTLNHNKELVKYELLKAGWSEKDISSAFKELWP